MTINLSLFIVDMNGPMRVVEIHHRWLNSTSGVPGGKAGSPEQHRYPTLNQ